MFVKYFFIITLQTGNATFTNSGILEVEPGTTREAMFSLIHEHAITKSGMAPASVVFFSVERNEM